jgi:S-(hydroxymethyl)glutathione dehydrogenase / alcohol dehydrogenase
VVECGPGAKGLKPGDHVIPLYIPECGDYAYCRSTKTDLCQSIASRVWTGYMPDGTRRFSQHGKPIFFEYLEFTNALANLRGQPDLR